MSSLTGGFVFGQPVMNSTRKREPFVNASIPSSPPKLSNTAAILIEEDDCVVNERNNLSKNETKLY